MKISDFIQNHQETLKTLRNNENNTRNLILNHQTCEKMKNSNELKNWSTNWADMKEPTPKAMRFRFSFLLQWCEALFLLIFMNFKKCFGITMGKYGKSLSCHEVTKSNVKEMFDHVFGFLSKPFIQILTSHFEMI